MKKDNVAVIKELKLIIKRMERLRESFRLEKEEALKEPDISVLAKFRERSRSLYLISVAECSREITRLGHCISSDQPGMEEADDLVKFCRKEAMHLAAHLTSTPNRLIRVFKTGDTEN